MSELLKKMEIRDIVGYKSPPQGYDPTTWAVHKDNPNRKMKAHYWEDEYGDGNVSFHTIEGEHVFSVEVDAGSWGNSYDPDKVIKEALLKALDRKRELEMREKISENYG